MCSSDLSMKKKILAGLTMATVFGISTITVSAATIGIANAYVRLYDATVVENESPDIVVVDGTEIVLHTADGLDEGFIEEEGEVIECYSARIAQAFEWEIKKGYSRKTPDFEATAGQTITVSIVCSPDDAVIHAGIIRPDGSRVYAEGSGSFMCPFPVYTDGKYSTYVQNLSDGKITLSGSYLVTN